MPIQAKPVLWRPLHYCSLWPAFLFQEGVLSLARQASFGGISPGTRETCLIAHVVGAVLGTAALWWFVMPGAALEATADGISALWQGLC